MCINLIVKGSKAVAMAVAAQHGIPTMFISECRFGEQILRTADRFLGQVLDWFCDGPDEAPFGHGDLLHYSFSPVARRKP